VDARIEPAQIGDLDDVLRLLIDQQLPPDGLRDHVGTMLVARQGGHIVGSAAVEMYEHGALLRSVVVAPGRERQGLGRQLTDAAIRLAAGHHAAAIYLLTTTAAEYFPKFGFVRIARTDVPATVQASVEFQWACPASAIVMRKSL
jgi:amino-acid N-acetyltransferase